MSQSLPTTTLPILTSVFGDAEAARARVLSVGNTVGGIATDTRSASQLSTRDASSQALWLQCGQQCEAAFKDIADLVTVKTLRGYTWRYKALECNQKRVIPFAAPAPTDGTRDLKLRFSNAKQELIQGSELTLPRQEVLELEGISPLPDQTEVYTLAFVFNASHVFQHAFIGRAGLLPDGLIVWESEPDKIEPAPLREPSSVSAEGNVLLEPDITAKVDPTSGEHKAT